MTSQLTGSRQIHVPTFNYKKPIFFVDRLYILYRAFQTRTYNNDGCGSRWQPSRATCDEDWTPPTWDPDLNSNAGGQKVLGSTARCP